MKRVDVILTQAIESDFVEKYDILCKREKIPCKYTKIDNVTGQGNTNPKLGDPVWPQMNTMFIIYCEDNIANEIGIIMNTLHKEYVGEGAASFVSDANVLV